MIRISFRFFQLQPDDIRGDTTGSQAGDRDGNNLWQQSQMCGIALAGEFGVIGSHT